MIKKWLDDGIFDPTAELNITGDIAARVNVKRILEIYRPEIDNGINMIKKQMEMGMANAPQGFDIAKIIEIEIELLQSLANQLDTPFTQLVVGHKEFSQGRLGDISLFGEYRILIQRDVIPAVSVVSSTLWRSNTNGSRSLSGS